MHQDLDGSDTTHRIRIGPYRIEDRLGRGGMGIVYRAWDERLRRWVAVKHIRQSSRGSKSDPASRERSSRSVREQRARLRREARLTASLSHPHIMRVFDILRHEEDDWIVMELVDGPRLTERLKVGALDLLEGLKIGRQVAEGLDHAHRRGVIHRDLKAENILLSAEEGAKIVDFGLAKATQPDQDATLATATGAVMGTYRVMAPEQARGLEVDARADLFSLGVLLYEMLLGDSPFRGQGPAETLDRVCHHQPTPACELDPRIPVVVSHLVEMLLEKDRHRRPADAGQVAARLAKVEVTLASAVFEDETIG